MSIITVIIPTYNRSVLLQKAIKSVLSQSYPHFRLIVLDNHSTDNTPDIVREYQEADRRIAYIRHKSNIGMMKNYEHAFTLIESDYFHLLSDDDYIMPEFYRKGMDVFLQNPKLGFYAASTKIISESNRVIRIPNEEWPKEGSREGIEAIIEMIGKYPVPTTILFSKKILEKVQPDFTNSRFWDCDFLMHISIHFSFYLDKELAGYFVSHENSYSRAPAMQEEYESFNKMLARIEKNTDLSERNKKIIQIEIKRDFINVFFASFTSLLLMNRLDLVEDFLSKLSTFYVINKSFFPIRVLHYAIKIMPFLKEVLKLGINIRRCARNLIRRQNFIQ